jgi:hypothetical protein
LRFFSRRHLFETIQLRVRRGNRVPYFRQDRAQGTWGRLVRADDLGLGHKLIRASGGQSQHGVAVMFDSICNTVRPFQAAIVVTRVQSGRKDRSG